MLIQRVIVPQNLLSEEDVRKLQHKLDSEEETIERKYKEIVISAAGLRLRYS